MAQCLPNVCMCFKVPCDFHNPSISSFQPEGSQPGKDSTKRLNPPLSGHLHLHQPPKGSPLHFSCHYPQRHAVECTPPSYTKQLESSASQILKSTNKWQDSQTDYNLILVNTESCVSTAMGSDWL